MNKRQYDAYVDRFIEFLDNEDIDCLVEQDIDSWIGFSAEPCDCCGTHLAGKRYICNGYNPTINQIQYDYRICPDCLYFAEYGQLDDMAMMEIENSE